MEEVVLGISMEDDNGGAKKKDREVDVPSCGGGLDLGFGFGYRPSHDVDEVSCHREKMIRTDAFPFRAATAATSSPIFTAAASASTPLPPLHPSVSLPPFGNGASMSLYGPNMFRAAERAGAHQDAAARSLQIQLQASLAASPFKSASHSASAPPVSTGTSYGAAAAATALLPHHPLFTPAQWQELQRQALIYKHFVSAAPVPPDLLLDTRSIHPNAAVALGGGFLNLRLAGGSADPEPGRCRRTDGKKWRCSRDAAPDQRYCERHLHRGRPRSRKPVEHTRNKTVVAASAAAADGKDSNNSNGASDLGGATATATAFSGLPSKSSTLQVSPPPYYGAALPKPELMKLPFLSILPEKEEPRYLDWMKDGGIPEISHHAVPDNSTGAVDIAAGFRTPVLPVLQGYPDYRHLNTVGLSDLNAPSYYYPFVNAEQPPPPRRFIDAWSAEGQHTVPASSSSRDMDQFAAAASSEQLSPSSLTLSMSGGSSGRGCDYVSEHIQMGLAVNELSSNNKSQPMFGSFGGPLAEVLQSGSSSVASPRTTGGGDCCGLVGPPAATSYTGLMNLMSRSCCSGSEGVISPSGESPPRVLSSPTGVLQRGLVSLSDSSSNSSPRFGATGCGGARPEVVGFQWMNQNNKKWW